MITVVAWAAPVLVLAGCAAYACAALRGHSGGSRCLPRAAAAFAARALLVTVIAVLAGVLKTAVLVVRAGRAARSAGLRARWAWHCRGLPPPASETSPLDERERAELITILRGRKKTARPERSRT